MWLVLGIIGYSLLAVVAILDKFVVSNEKVKPIVFVFYSTFFLPALFLLVPFGIIAPLGSIGSWIIAALAGASYSLALAAMYIGFSEGEVSHVGPFIGAAVPFFTLILNHFFLHDALTLYQYLGIALLIIGSLVISFEKTKKGSSLERGTQWATLAAFCFAFFYTASKAVYPEVGFLSGIIWIWGATGLCSLLLLLSPTVRAALRKKKPKIKRQTHELAVIAVDKALAIAAVGLIQFAVSLGNVSILNALNGLQYGLLIIFVAVLSKFFPRRFKEKYEPHELMQEMFAVIIIACGLVFLII